MQEYLPVIIFCSVIAILVPLFFYVFLKRRYSVNSAPFWAGVITFIVFALFLERLALDLLRSTELWARLMVSPVKAVALSGLIAGIFEEGGCLISMKISSLLENKKDKEEEEVINVSDEVKRNIMEVESERNHALMHGLGHGGAVIFVFVLTMVLNLVYAFNGGSSVSLSVDRIDSMASAAIIEAMTSMQDFHPMDFIYSLVEEIASLGIHISLAVMVWISMKGSWYMLFFPLSILLHALSDILVEVLIGSGLSEFMCVVFFVMVSLTIVQFTIIVWHKIKMGTVLTAVQNASEEAG